MLKAQSIKLTLTCKGNYLKNISSDILEKDSSKRVARRFLSNLESWDRNHSKGKQLSKSDYVEKIAQDNRPHNLPKQAIKEIVNETFTFILQSLQKDHKFTYPGFGSFRLKNRKARKGTNPNTGEQITIASRKAISFTVSEKLKKKLR